MSKRCQLCGVVCGLLLIFTSGCGEAPNLGLLFPETIGSIPRTEFLVGKEALTAVDRLHGQSIHAEDAAVVAYGADHPPLAQIWVSRASNGAEAREQLAVMINRMMAAKSAPFQPPVQERRAGVDLYRTEGMGMVHLIWSRDDLVWWLAVLPDQEDVFLQRFLVQDSGGK